MKDDPRVGHERQTHGLRTAAREARSAPARSDHRSHGADPSHLQQSRSWFRLEDRSLAQALQNPLQQTGVCPMLNADHCSTWKLYMNRP